MASGLRLKMWSHDGINVNAEKGVSPAKKKAQPGDEYKRGHIVIVFEEQLPLSAPFNELPGGDKPHKWKRKISNIDVSATASHIVSIFVAC